MKPKSKKGHPKFKLYGNGAMLLGSDSLKLIHARLKKARKIDEWCINEYDSDNGVCDFCNAGYFMHKFNSKIKTLGDIK